MRPLIALPILLFLTFFAAGATKLTTSTELRVLHTNHYRIHSDFDRALAEDIAQRMDAMYEEYTRRLATFETDHSGGKFDVYLFSKRKNYMDFMGNQMSNAGGVTMPERRMIASDLENQGRDRLRQTMQHEAFHLFAHAVIHPDLPPWANEGLAVMFEEGIWTGRMFLLGQVPPRRVRQLQQDIAANRIVDFRSIMKMTLNDWNTVLNTDKKRGSLNYNQAWAMCHFLVYATENNRPKYRARFLDMLQRIHAGTEPGQAFEEAFSSNVEGFQKLFLQWAKDLRPTVEATIIERQNILSDMLIRFSQQGKRFDSIADFRKMLVDGGYQMQYASGDIKWQTDADPRVYFSTIESRPYNADELYFDTRTGAALPDLVCDPVGQIHLRTRFYDQPGNNIEHETLVEGGGSGR